MAMSGREKVIGGQIRLGRQLLPGGGVHRMVIRYDVAWMGSQNSSYVVAA